MDFRARYSRERELLQNVPFNCVHSAREENVTHVAKHKPRCTVHHKSVDHPVGPNDFFMYV